MGGSTHSTPREVRPSLLIYPPKRKWRKIFCSRDKDGQEDGFSETGIHGHSSPLPKKDKQNTHFLFLLLINNREAIFGPGVIRVLCRAGCHALHSCQLPGLGEGRRKGRGDLEEAGFCGPIVVYLLSANRRSRNYSTQLLTHLTISPTQGSYPKASRTFSKSRSYSVSFLLPSSLFTFQRIQCPTMFFPVPASIKDLCELVHFIGQGRYISSLIQTNSSLLPKVEKKLLEVISL